MSIWLLLLVALAAGWWWSRRGRADVETKPGPVKLKSVGGKSAFFASAEEFPYRAVSIKPGTHACASAYALSTQRFLVGDTPKVPVQDCTERNCECRYRHHRDRRRASGDRRAIQSYGASVAASGGDERRRSHGRRSEDRDAA